MNNRKTREVKIGDVTIGGGNDIAIQSMTNTKTADVVATVAQIKELEEAGCDIVRVTANDEEAARAIKEIKKQINIPIVADIHFDYKLALLAVEAGADKIRINPGNIGDEKRVKEVVDACKKAGIPIRVGVNSGSLKRSVVDKYGGATADALVESACEQVQMLERFDFYNMVVAIKSSNVMTSVEAFKKFGELYDYPLHIGITESGTLFSGTIKSSVGLGILLYQGYGDTIRVSLTADPVEEIKVAKELLKSLGLRTGGVNIVSCPTCGRTEIDLIGIANEVVEKTKHLNKDITIAVMGCIVNGPGEAREADIGIAGGDGFGIIFKKGKLFKKVKEEDLVESLIYEVTNG